MRAAKPAKLFLDCLPAPAFFRYYATMRERHRHDNRIAIITGSNKAPLAKIPGSHGFSPITASWVGRSGGGRGMAFVSFLRLSARTIPGSASCMPMRLASCARNSPLSPKARPGTWDYQFTVQVLRAEQLNVFPARNLILNIGFDGRATHFGKGGRTCAAPAFAYDTVGEGEDSPSVVADELKAAASVTDSG